MTDGTPKGTGNSRRLKSNISAATTWEQFRAALIAGTLPIDLLFNAAGWDVVGTALSKANLLTDATAALLGLTASATVNDAFTVLSGKAGIEVVTYPGNGTYGSQNPCTVTFAKQPDIVIIQGGTGMTPYAWGDSGFGVYDGSLHLNWVTASGNTMSWYLSEYSGFPKDQLNEQGVTYKAIAISAGG